MKLDDARRFYAEEVALAARIQSPALVEALATVPREKFLGPGPWRIASPTGLGQLEYFSTRDADPRHVYHNVLIAIDESRSLNNGQPASLASWIAALDLEKGDKAVHLGAGVGYYTAIMAEMVGPQGRVVAYEVDPALAARASENLAGYQNVECHAGDGTLVRLSTVDAMFVNAGVTHPRRAWLEGLNEGGRLVVPITAATEPNAGRGVMLRITRQRDHFVASAVSYTAIYHCTGGRNPDLETAVGKALTTGTLIKVKSARVDPHAADESCVIHFEGEVCLSLT